MLRNPTSPGRLQSLHAGGRGVPVDRFLGFERKALVSNPVELGDGILDCCIQTFSRGGREFNVPTPDGPSLIVYWQLGCFQGGQDSAKVFIKQLGSGIHFAIEGREYFANCRVAPIPTNFPILNLCTASTRILRSFPVNQRQWHNHLLLLLPLEATLHSSFYPSILLHAPLVSIMSNSHYLQLDGSTSVMIREFIAPHSSLGYQFYSRLQWRLPC